ncbi:hypothetical protein [Paenibacillus sp.]|uniref:hypothetical protein n=1 Tax=Paenibacillus sp. TaxID=58172 RepID=UPI0028121473|nr:hypothetical protein [Paenibacillus sp.]
MTDKFLLWIALVVPWFSLFFLKKNVIKRYMPVAVFTVLIVTVVFEIAHALKWWKMLEWIVPWGYITNVSFVYGTFAVGTIWIFFFTYRNFWMYLATNAAVDALQAFVFDNLFEGRVYRLVRLNDVHVFLLMMGISLIIYVYQKWQEGIFAKDAFPSRSMEVGFRNPFRGKQGAK